jgi:hypothetical protein
VASARREAAAAPPAHGWIAGAWKWGAGSLSAGAALVSIISSVRDAAGAGQVRWIGIAPAADTAWAIGDTIQLATTLTDAHGGVLPGVAVGWTSTDSAVASVDSAGTVVARAAGAATVVAAAGGRIAQSRIVVRQRPAAIRVLGDTLLRLPEGGSMQLAARVVDARRHAVPGQTITWRSTDPPTASVDSAARVTAAMAGRVLLSATSGDVTAELPLEVYPLPATITLLAGDGQHASTGRPLPGPVKAQVVSRSGRPMPGVTVRFLLGDESGHLEQETDTSDADGIVRAGWTLGTRPGRQRLALSTDGEPPITTIVVAEADPVPENTRVTALGDGLSGAAGSALAPVAVRIADSLGTPMADVPVTWVTAGGTIVADGARTDSLGEARARWTLGPRAGVQQAYVQVGASRAGSRPVLTAVALPGPAASLARISAGVLRGQVGRPLARPAELRVSDRAGNPVPGIVVTLRAESGAVGVRAPVTDSLGRIGVAWTLGPTAGVQRLSASVAGVERSLELTVDARPRAAAKAVLEGVPASGTAGRALPRPIVVAVADSFGNGVAGALVAFTARAGRVAPARARTDPEGRAAVRWTLGNTPGEQRLEVSVNGGGGRTVAKVRAVSAGKLKPPRPSP